MAWSKDNLLAIGADDNRISVMLSNGSILQRCDTNEAPRNVKFSEMKREKRGTYEESTVCFEMLIVYHIKTLHCPLEVSAVIGRKQLGLWTVGDPNSNAPPVAGSQLFTLNFQDKYGDIIDYQW